MPLRLDIKRKLSSRSERVKSVDLHPTEPWVLSALYSGSIMIWNYDTQSLVKTIEVCGLPVRNAKFVARKQWIITSSDDMQIRVFNYNTMEKVTAFEAHTDYIRHVEVHPTLPCFLTCGDDMTIKMWDWEKNWLCTQLFEGHGHYVMMVKFNPKDTNTFASASLDRTIRVWGLNSNHPHFSLDGHERGVNCIDYYPGGDKPYLISGSDDRTVKIWDYQTKAIIHTLDGHGNNLTSVLYHPRLPIIISACEDGAVRMWHSTTYRAETTLNYGMERSWSLAALKSANKLAIGYDEGTIVLRLGHDTPVVSMDPSGKLIWTNNNDVHTASVKGIVAEMSLQDGEKVPLISRELGNCEVYPQKVKHNNNGRYVVVCGDGEYIIYTSQQLRNKAFGSGLDFAWSPTGTGDYVVRESISKVTLFKNFKEYKAEKPRVLSAEGLFGGTGAICVKGNDCIAMFDWEELRLIRKIDVSVKNVFWSESGNLVVLACANSFYVLRYNKEVVAQAFASGTNNAEEGVDGAFDLLHEISEKVGTGTWVGDCFLYTNTGGRLNYYVGGEVMTLAHLEQKMYMLGYLPRENLVFLMDKMKNVYSYTVSLVMLEYQTAVVRRDFETANAILPKIPQDQMDYVARFLESQGFKEEALALSTDPDQKFDLAVQLAKLDVARDIMLQEIDQKAGAGGEMSTDTQHKWKQLGDLALNDYQFALAEDCALRAEDFSLLLILYSSRGDATGLERLAQMAQEKRRYNIAFICLLLLNKTSECVEVLKETKRFPEAAFFARSYCPSKIQLVMDKWRENLSAVSTRAAKALADPFKNPELFENFELSLQAEAILAQTHANAPATSYLQKQELLESESILHAILSGSVGNSATQFASPPADEFHDSISSHAEAEAEAAQLAQFQAQQAEEEARIQAEAYARAEAEARAREEQAAREQFEAEARARAEHEAREQAEAEARARAQAEHEARLRAEAEVRAQEEARLQAIAEQEARLRAQAEEEARLRAQAEEEARMRAQAEEEARLRAQAEAEAYARAQAEAEAYARAQAEEEANRNAFNNSSSDFGFGASSTSSFGGSGTNHNFATPPPAPLSGSFSHSYTTSTTAHGTTTTTTTTTTNASTTSGLLDFELENAEMEFDEDDDADWGEIYCGTYGGNFISLFPSSSGAEKQSRGEGQKAMRVVCLSDTHGLHDALQKTHHIPHGDVFVHAGDFTDTGARDEVVAFNDFLGKLPHKYKLVIAGNHESTFDAAFYPKHWQQYGHRQQYNPVEVRALLTNALYLEDQAVMIDGFTFYGSPWQPEFCSWAFNLPRGEPLLAKWKHIPAETDVLITHTPPLGKGDLVGHYMNVGCADLLREVQTRIRPTFHVFGHVHEGYGRSFDGTTNYLNASACTHDYEAINPALVFDLSAPKIPQSNSDSLPNSYARMLHEQLRMCSQKPPFVEEDTISNGEHEVNSSSSCRSLREFRVDGTTSALLFESTLKLRPLVGVQSRALRYLFHQGFANGGVVSDLLPRQNAAGVDTDGVHDETELANSSNDEQEQVVNGSPPKGASGRRKLSRRVTVAVLGDSKDRSNDQHHHLMERNETSLVDHGNLLVKTTTTTTTATTSSSGKPPRTRRNKTLQRRAAVAILSATPEEPVHENSVMRNKPELANQKTKMATSSHVTIEVSTSSSTTEQTNAAPSTSSPSPAADCVLCKYKVPGHVHPGMKPSASCGDLASLAAVIEVQPEPPACDNVDDEKDEEDTAEDVENERTQRERTIGSKRISSWF